MMTGLAAIELNLLRQKVREYFALLHAQQVEIFGDDAEDIMAEIERSSTGSRRLAELRKELETAVAAPR